MKSLFGEFKTFIMKGNVIDLAVGVLIGTAFNDVVKDFTESIIKPLLGALGANPEVGLKIWVLDVGRFISAVIKFLMMAAILFLFFVKPINQLRARTMKKAETSAVPPPLPEDIKLLMEIRDLLKANGPLTTPAGDATGKALGPTGV